ncbi:MAG: alcohol dehydrogenase catalytic domain-containing protein, partial [Lachnospiraceae bacterium]|nr:alcohol dehydrogenase catalytic domain-containing protein [Lachnospiraceae bacterium]
MKAWVLHDVNDIRFEEVNEPQPAADEVLVSVKAAGICGSDIPRIYKTGAHVHPLIPGHEFSGQVVRAGDNVDSAWNGKRVGIFPLIPCGRCATCQKQQYEMCRDYSYLGSRRDGGFAEYVAVPEWNLIELPENVSYEEAAMLEPMAVAVHAMRRVNPNPKDTVVICGLGTIGMFLLMFLLDAGIENIFVVGNKEFQRNTVLKMGLDENNYCDSKKQDVSE